MNGESKIVIEMKKLVEQKEVIVKKVQIRKGKRKIKRAKEEQLFEIVKRKRGKKERAETCRRNECIRGARQWAGHAHS